MRSNDYPASLVLEFFKAKNAAYISPRGVETLAKQSADDFVLIDVRIPAPHLTWRIPGAIAIPTNEIAERLAEIPKDKLIILYCWDTWCSLATTAALILLGNGYRVKELYGGVAAWQGVGLPQMPVTVSTVAPPVCKC
jgi:rhodanese-related sulfurtransferase